MSTATKTPLDANRHFDLIYAIAKQDRWVLGAARWRSVGCQCGCSGDGVAQWRNPECPFHGDDPLTSEAR